VQPDELVRYWQQAIRLSVLDAPDLVRSDLNCPAVLDLDDLVDHEARKLVPPRSEVRVEHRQIIVRRVENERPGHVGLFHALPPGEKRNVEQRTDFIGPRLHLLKPDLALRRLLRSQALERPFRHREMRGTQMLQEMIEIAEMSADGRGLQSESDGFPLLLGFLRTPATFIPQFTRRQAAQARATT